MRLGNYSAHIALFDAWSRPEPLHSVKEVAVVVVNLLKFFIAEEKQERPIPDNTAEQRSLLRALLNIRAPIAIPEEVSLSLNQLLWTERIESGVITQFEEFTAPHKSTVALWKGDITRIAVDAIVNAANAELLGCFQPLHSCIDNAIHSAAGPNLRTDCAKLMALQGHREVTGAAKITRAYNLPARFVLHTVGPIVRGSLNERQRSELKSCYDACLNLAAEVGIIDSIAFCAISTGLFGFPADEAAPIAVNSVKTWLETNPGRIGKVLFNVFTEEDYERYRRIISL